MPSIEANRKSFQEQVENGTLVPTTNVDVRPPIPAATYPAAPNPYIRTPLPNSYWQQPDSQRQFHNAAVPQVRIPPQPPTSNAVSGAQSASQTIVVTQKGQGLGILVNGLQVPTPQGVIDFLNTGGVTWAFDSQGNLTATVSASGDGLIHGTTPSAGDPSAVLLLDDFLGGNSTSGSIGTLGWTLNTSSAGTNSIVRGSQTGLPISGAFEMANSATTNGYAVIFPGTTTGLADDKYPLFDYPGWKVTIVFGFALPLLNVASSFAKKSIYVGLASSWNTSNGAGFGVRPTTFMGVRYDTDTTAPSIADSTFHFEVVQNITNQTNLTTRNNTQGTTFDTGVTPAIGTMYRLDIEMVAAGTITMSLNGSTPQTFSVPSATAGGAADSPLVTIKSNVGWVELGETNTQNQSTIFSSGSIVTVSGFAGSGAPFNQTVTLQLSETTGGSTPLMGYPVVAANLAPTAGTAGATAVGFPAVIPVITFGNSSTAGSTANECRILVDFFSMEWNPGIISASAATPDSTKPRYF